MALFSPFSPTPDPEAEQTLRRATELDGNDGRAWWYLGRLLQRDQSRGAEARDAFLKALRVDPFDDHHLSGILSSFDNLSQSRDGLPIVLTVIESIHQLRPDHRDTTFVLAQLLSQSDRWCEAAPILEKLAKDEGDLSSSGPFRAAVETGHTSDAIALLERTGADQRWRPLYEALRAVAAGSPDYLNRVAPEIRTVALKIWEELTKSASKSG